MLEFYIKYYKDTIQFRINNNKLETKWSKCQQWDKCEIDSNRIYWYNNNTIPVYFTDDVIRDIDIRELTAFFKAKNNIDRILIKMGYDI